MKELIYRRTDTGYQIDRCPPELPRAMQAAGSGYAMAGMPGGVDTAAPYYRQFRLSNGALVVGASYRDPFGDRRSGMADLLFAMDRDEALKVLASYPLGSRYFYQKKQLYSQSGSTGQTWNALEMPVSDFAGPRSGNLEMGCKMLAGVFGERALLAAMFSALLDVASNNPRMIVLFGPREDDERMAEHGRSIIEALLACLPPTAALHIGYISPAENDDANALFGIRYSRRREISPAVLGYTYVFDLEKKECRAPGQAKMDGSGYAARLAELVFRGDAAAVARIKDLRTMLDSPALFDAADVPGSVGMFYRIAERPSELSAQEMRALLSWRHDAVDRAEQGTRPLDDQPMWRVVEHWALTSAIADLLEKRGQWRDDDPVYSPARAEELFGDSQRLHRMGRAEAKAWPPVYGKYLEGVKPEDPAGKALVKHFHDLAAQGPASIRDWLYWDQLSEWVLRHWSGALYGDALVVETLDKYSGNMPALAERFARSEAEVCAKRKALRDEGLTSSYAVQVFRLLMQKPDSAAEALRRALKPRDPYGDAAALALYLRYKELISGNERMARTFDAACADALKAHLAGSDVRALLEMRQMRGPFAETVQKLGIGGDLRSAIDGRLRAAAGREGIYPYYPDDPATARRLAEALGDGWPDRLNALEQANAVNVARLTPAELERLMREGVFTSDDRELEARLRAMLEDKLRAAFNGAPVSEPMLVALALQSVRGGMIYPDRALKAADRLGVPEKRVLAFCKKLAEPEAVRGMGYLARVFLTDGAPPAPYPGQRASKTNRSAPREWFAAIPMAAAAVAAPLFAVGLALCAMGLLRKFGL